MRISDRIARLATCGMALGLAGGLWLGAGSQLAPEQAFAFDGTTSPSTAALSPTDGLRPGARVPATSEQAKALTALQYAADQGQPVAQWKLGHMYAEGDGVPHDDLRAFDYFSQIANTHPDEAPGTPQARFVSNAFVALGHYYLTGIPPEESWVKPIYDNAFQHASDDERAMALVYLEDWLKGRRD